MSKAYTGIFTLPNLLTFYRLLLAPLLYLSLAEGMRDVCLLVFLLSAASDVADGLLARRLDQVSDFGKMIDPVADKLTYFFILLGLCRQNPEMTMLLIVLIVKESLCSITSLLAIRSSERIRGARLHGKINACVLFLTVLLQLTPLSSHLTLRYVSIALSILTMIISCFFYVKEHIETIRHSDVKSITDLIKK